MRDGLADLLDRLAVALWSVAHRLRPVYQGPLCPDCQTGPDVGDDCPVCLERQEAQLHEHAMYTAGHQDGWEAAEDKYRDE